MEYWSVGVARQFGIAPRVRGVGRPFQGDFIGLCDPGPKPWPKPWAIMRSRFAAAEHLDFQLCQQLALGSHPVVPFIPRKSQFASAFGNEVCSHLHLFEAR
jgi:hypothetical protein